jgi:STAS domain.
MDGIALEHIGDTTILRCNRSLTVKNLDEFMTMFQVLVQRQEMGRIMFVLSPHTRVDASGVGLLVQMHAILVEGGKRLYVCMPSPDLVSLLKDLELNTFLRTLTSEEDLLLRLPD